MELIFLVWLAGAALSLLYRVYKHLRFLRTVRRWSRPVKNRVYQDALTYAKASLGVHAGIRLRVCRSIDSPMLIGLFRPTILLPSLPLTATEVDLVLRHELTHLRRGDIWGRVLLLAVSSLHWFNPLLPLIARAVSFQCEAACDAAVLQSGTLAVRAAYGQTILHMLRVKPGIHTALSTRYHGGKATMKKRIRGIMDTRVRKLGAMIVALLLVAVLATGMAFAVGTEVSAALTEIEANEIANRLRNKLHALYQLYGETLPQTERLNASYQMNAFYFSTLEEWTAYEEAIDAVDSLEAYTTLLHTDYVGVNQAPKGQPQREEAQAAAVAILQAMGYPELVPSATQYIPNELQLPVTPSWFFGLSEADADTSDGLYTGAYRNIALHQDLRLESMPLSFYGVPAAGDITEAQRQFARETAQAFCEAHVFRLASSMDAVYVSDRFFTQELEEPYTYVWIHAYTREADGYTDAYDPAHPEVNAGLEFAIGLETGRIYGVDSFVHENEFVNRHEAEMDWTATGRAYPVVDQSYLVERVGPDIERLLNGFAISYNEELSEADRVKLWHLCMGSLGQSILLEAEWEAFLRDLEAADSAAAVSAVLHTDYAAINQGVDDATSRASYEAYARAVLDTIGYGHMEHLSFLYLGMAPDSVYEVGTARLGAEAFATEADVRLTLSQDGLLSSLQTMQSLQYGERAPITEEASAFVAEKALYYANTIAAIAKADCETVRVDAYTYPDEISGERSAYAWVYAGDINPYTGETDGSRYGLIVQIGLDTGTLYSLSTSMEQGYDGFMSMLANI